MGYIHLLNIYFSWNLFMRLSMLPRPVALVQMLVYLRHRSQDFEQFVIGYTLTLAPLCSRYVASLVQENPPSLILLPRNGVILVHHFSSHNYGFPFAQVNWSFEPLLFSLEMTTQFSGPRLPALWKIALFLLPIAKYSCGNSFSTLFCRRPIFHNV